MADPITIIGTAGAAANIIEVLNSTISSLRQLHNQWKDADFTLMNLAAQLAALKAALGKIQEWMLSGTADPHHQLVMDLDLSMSCCQALVGRMGSKVSELNYKENGKLDNKSRVKLVFGGKSMEEIQKMVERQTNALTLLLTACNCSTMSQQKAVLEKYSTRKVMKRTRDDSSSLYVLQDTTSLLSRCTDGLSKLSLIFPFDKELLNTGVYQRILRSSLKESIRRQRAHVGLPWSKPRPYSAWTEQESRNSLRGVIAPVHEVRILLAGERSARECLVANLLDSYRPMSTEECSQWREWVEYCCMFTFRNVFEALKDSPMPTTQVDADDTRTLYERISAGNNFKFDVDSVKVLKRFWENSQVQEFIENFKHLRKELYSSRSQFNAFEVIEAAVDPKTKPTHLDYLKARLRFNRIEERQLVIGELPCRIIDVDYFDSTISQDGWIHLLNHIEVAIFAVDLSCYDKHDFENGYSTTNAMLHAMENFDGFINSTWMRIDKPMVLLFTNQEAFSSQVAVHPLKDYFPDFEGGYDYFKACDYILDRFMSLSKGHPRQIETVWCNNDGTTSRFLRLVQSRISPLKKRLNSVQIISGINP